MRYAVIDLETTGFSHRDDRVVEMACVIVDQNPIAGNTALPGFDALVGHKNTLPGNRTITHTWSTLVNPQRSIPWYATRVHGITDEHVTGAPSFEVAQQTLRRLCIGATIVAHNARFDLGFLPALEHMPSLCTVALARRCFPEAPNFKNQTLREYLGIALEGDAHRALADALVTAQILMRCLTRFKDAA